MDHSRHAVTKHLAEDEFADEDDGAQGEQVLQEKLNRRTFVVARRSLLALSNLVAATEVFLPK